MLIPIFSVISLNNLASADVTKLLIFYKNKTIKKMARFFVKEELKTLVTSLYFSKFSYESEVWHLPDRTSTQNKESKFESANALRLCYRNITVFNSHTEI